jgi:FAS-associated factor 2
MSEDLDDLTTSQREALGQLQAITNGADIPSEIAILASVNWDVQVGVVTSLPAHTPTRFFYKRAAEAIFDSQTSTNQPKLEQMRIDDSTQGLPPPNRTHVCTL